MRRLALRGVVFAVLFLGSAAVLCRLLLPGHARWFDPRQRLFYERDLGGYPVALLGTSVFASTYVDREDQTLWRRLTAVTGADTFPGAVNGFRAGDMLAAARWLGERLPRGSVVFVEAHPLNTWRVSEAKFRTRFLVGGLHYGEEGALVRAWNAWGHPLVADALRARELFMSLAARSGDSADRRWDRSGDFALKRYRASLEAIGSSEIPPTVDASALAAIRDALVPRGMRPIFVLTPLNRAEIEAFSPPGEAARMRDFLARRDRELTRALAAAGLPALDLRGAVPPEGFADLIHTNALGDRLVADALAEALASAPGKGEDGLRPGTARSGPPAASAGQKAPAALEAP